MQTYPRIVEVRFWEGSATVELSTGESFPADTDAEIQEIADASMHSVEQVREIVDDYREGTTDELSE